MNRGLLRAAAVLTALFTAGHSTGTYSEPQGVQAGVAAVMRSVRFPLFGADRSYWDMFHGYGVMVIFVGAFLAVLLWLLSRMPRETARPLVLLTAVLQIAIAVVAYTSFFWAPALLNALSAACAAAAAAKS